MKFALIINGKTNIIDNAGHAALEKIVGGPVHAQKIPQKLEEILNFRKKFANDTLADATCHSMTVTEFQECSKVMALLWKEVEIDMVLSNGMVTMSIPLNGVNF